MKLVLALIAGSLLILLAPVLFPGKPHAPVSTSGMPWQVEVNKDGSTRVFGLTLGRSTLRDAARQFAESPAVAVVGTRNEDGTLEAYFETVTLGGLKGRIVLSLHTTTDQLRAMRQRSPKTEFMESTTRRSELSAGDRDLADGLPIRALSYLPAARLDAATLIQRFGAPTERIIQDEIEHLLYPVLGLDIATGAKGRTVIQYVAPSDFNLLRAPLTAPGISEASH